METKQPELKNVKLTDITVSKTNPRKHFDEESVLELAESIREKGIIQPIVLRPNGAAGKYELVCGERRYRASVMVKGAIKTRDTIPAIIRELSDEEVLQLQIIENLQRKDIHPMDEAVAFNALMAIKGFDLAEIAKRIGKGPAYVATRLKLNDLIDSFQKAFYKDRINLSLALKISRLNQEDQSNIWEDRGSDEEADKIEISEWHLKKYQHKLDDAPFDTKDATLNNTMGACTKCPFNSASNTLLFPDLANASICSNSKCFSGKVDTSYQRLFDQAKNDPSTILVSTEWKLGPEAQKLIAKGIQIYETKEFANEDKPEMPNFEDDFKGNNDIPTEDQEEFNEAVADYQEDLKKYEVKISSGKYLKAFVVEGHQKGTFIYVTLKKATSPKAVAGATEGENTTADIKSEIQRIKDREKRGLELDEEKKQPLLFDLIRKSSFLKATSPLVLSERRGLLILLAEFGSYSIRNELYKAIGCKNTDDYNQARIYEFAATANEKQIDQWIAIATRLLFLHKLSPINGIRPQNSGKAAVLVELTKHYDKKGVDKIEAVFLEASAKREIKVESRVASLNKQLKELNGKKETKPAAKPTTKTPAKKATK